MDTNVWRLLAWTLKAKTYESNPCHIMPSGDQDPPVVNYRIWTILCHMGWEAPAQKKTERREGTSWMARMQEKNKPTNSWIWECIGKQALLDLGMDWLEAGPVEGDSWNQWMDWMWMGSHRHKIGNACVRSLSATYDDAVGCNGMDSITFSAFLSTIRRKYKNSSYLTSQLGRRLLTWANAAAAKLLSEMHNSKTPEQYTTQCTDVQNIHIMSKHLQFVTANLIQDVRCMESYDIECRRAESTSPDSLSRSFKLGRPARSNHVAKITTPSVSALRAPTMGWAFENAWCWKFDMKHIAFMN